MCGSSPKVPKPIPPPEYAEYAKQRSQLPRPAPGQLSTIFTSPLGLSGSAATTQKPTLLGQ